MFGLLGLFAIAMVTAATVNYISNTTEVTIDVSMPIELSIGDGDSTLLELYAGQSKTVIATTTVHVDGVTGHIAELTMVNFNGVGLTIDYVVPAYDGVFRLNACVEGAHTYYYIGDPSEVLDEDAFDSEVTFNTALDLDTTVDYTVETTVIMADKRACFQGSDYVFTPTA